MSEKKIAVGEESKPRFEYRTFGQSFIKEHQRLARLSVPVPEKVWERFSTEIYIISRTNDINNTKVRDGKMDIKTLVDIREGLEQWNPLMKGEFPISSETLLSAVFPAFQVTVPDLKKEVYTLEEFYQIINAHNDLQTVRVNKHRFAYMVNNTICEMAHVLINGARVMTLNSESTEIEDIKKTIKDVGLQSYENINYLQALKRVTGMIQKPLANENY